MIPRLNVVVFVVLPVYLLIKGDYTTAGCDSLQSYINKKWHIADIKGFLRNVKCTNDGKLLYKCTHSDDIYSIEEEEYGMYLKHTYSTPCSNDPHFYQACSQEESVVRDDSEKVTVCGRYTCTMEIESFIGNVVKTVDSSHGLDFWKICNGALDCKNTRLDEEQGCEEALSEKMGNLCNGRCDTWNCEDESDCRGFQYGRNCTIKLISSLSTKADYLHPVLSCKPVNLGTCLEGDDICRVTNQTQITCLQRNYASSFGARTIVPLHPQFRCAPLYQGYSFCIDLLDQTNCSDPAKVVLHCPISGWNSSVSLFKICLGAPVCDDNMDTMCVQITSECRIHKHKLCDGEIDCNDGSDEDRLIRCHTLSLTAESCSRRLAHTEDPKVLPIPLSWLRDGVRDCRNGRDEEEGWQSCGIGRTFRFVRQESRCQNVFLCPTGDVKYIEPDHMCDGIETCGNELLVCNRARETGRSRREDIVTSPSYTTRNGIDRHLSYCVKGLNHFEKLKGKCRTKRLKLGDQREIFGESKMKVFLPSTPRNCDYLFGENYVFSSCTGKCIDSPCPLMSYGTGDQCFGQFSNRVFTIADNSGLAFLRKNKGIFLMDYFVCRNPSICLDIGKVCDLVDDCGDGSDEANCTNHFQCAKSGYYIPKVAKCNGKFGCPDLSDECNNDCSARILNGWFLVSTSWSFGSIAVLTNSWLLFNMFRSLSKCKKESSLINKMHIIMISLGDLLIGVYLIAIAALDSVFYGNEYCHLQNAWKTGVSCKIFGVISSMGSHLSLYAMSSLSVIRCVTVKSPFKPSKDVTRKSFLKAISFILLPSMICASTISLLPLIETLEDYFVNGVTYDSTMKIFIGAVNKDTHSAVFEAYYGRMKQQTLSWKMIDQMVQGMYSRDFNYQILQRWRIPFYGNDAVCLFKYFVTVNDPQVYFVWSVLIMDLSCFCVIAICYIVIGITTNRSSRAVNHAKREQGRKCHQKNVKVPENEVTKRVRKTNRKVAIIISTDFICWVPFIVLCALHSIEVVNAAPWYSIISIVVLPINSIINPLLYDDALTKFLRPASLLARLRGQTFQLGRKLLKKFPDTDNEIELGAIPSRGTEKEVNGVKAESESEK